METPAHKAGWEKGNHAVVPQTPGKGGPVSPEVLASAQAVRGAWAVLWSRHSSAKDRFTALRMLLFLTFEDPMSSVYAYWISAVLLAAILVNALAFIAGSVKHNQYQPKHCSYPVCTPSDTSVCSQPVCEPQEKPILWQIEFATILMFTVDYVIRLLTVHAVPVELINPRSIDFTVDGKLKDRSAKLERTGCIKTLHYFFNILNIIDLISILPFYIHIAAVGTDAQSQDLGVLRVLRLLRVVRIFKLGRYSEGGIMLLRTLKASLPALVLFVFLTTITTIIFGSLMYFFETGHFTVTTEHPQGAYMRPNARGTGREMSPFTSILMGMYWAVVNTTTLGNCALYPTTTLGRLTSCVVAYCGILSLALPISIVGKNFTAQYNLVYGKSGGCFEGTGAHTPISVSRQSSARRLNRDHTRARSFHNAKSLAHMDSDHEKDGTSSRSLSAVSPRRPSSWSSVPTLAMPPDDTRLNMVDPNVPPLLVSEMQRQLTRLEEEVDSLKRRLRRWEEGQGPEMKM